MVVVIAGFSAYHDTLESEMQIIPNGQSEYNADMTFKLSGELKTTDNGKVYNIDKGSASQSLLFVTGGKIYSILTIQISSISAESSYIDKQNEFMWLDAENLTPEGSAHIGTDTITVEDISFRCNVYEYVSPESEQVYTYYIGINKPLIYKIDCQIHGLAQIESEMLVADMSITARLDYSSVMEGNYEVGETGDVQNIHMNGEEETHMSVDYDNTISNKYSGNLAIKTVSNNKFLVNTYMSGHGMYKEITLTLDKNSNTDEPYLKLYVPCTDGGHIGDSKYYDLNDNDDITNIRYEYHINYSCIDKDLIKHNGDYTIISIYDKTGNTLEKITIIGNEYLSKYESTAAYPSEISFTFESTGVGL